MKTQAYCILIASNFVIHPQILIISVHFDFLDLGAVQLMKIIKLQFYF